MPALIGLSDQRHCSSAQRQWYRLAAADLPANLAGRLLLERAVQPVLDFLGKRYALLRCQKGAELDLTPAAGEGQIILDLPVLVQMKAQAHRIALPAENFAICLAPLDPY